MSWTLVASARGTDSATLDSTGADFLVACFMTGVLGTITSWDNKSNTWTKLTESSVGGYRCTIAYCISPSSVGASHTITDPNAGVQNCELQFYAFNAPSAVSYHSENGANDATFGGDNTKSANYAGSMSVTPPSNDALIVCAVGTEPGSGTVTSYGVNSGFTLGLSQDSTAGAGAGASAYLNQAVAANVDPTISWTTTARWASAIAVFTVGTAPAVRIITPYSAVTF